MKTLVEELIESSMSDAHAGILTRLTMAQKAVTGAVKDFGIVRKELKKLHPRDKEVQKDTDAIYGDIHTAMVSMEILRREIT